MGFRSDISLKKSFCGALSKAISPGKRCLCTEVPSRQHRAFLLVSRHFLSVFACVFAFALVHKSQSPVLAVFASFC